MAKLTKELSANPDDLSLIPETYIVVRREPAAAR